jgi:hypothetical protein
MLSLRTALGYSTARFHGFYSRVQFEATSRLNNDNATNLDDDVTFPPGLAASRIKEGHSIIPDNPNKDINEAYFGWRSASGCPNAPAGCNGNTTVKIGRQQIIQTYDAARIDNTSINNLSASYVYLNQVRRTFGTDSAFNKFDMSPSHLINIDYKTPWGNLTGYGYLLDFDDNNRTPWREGDGTPGTPGIANFDSRTFGLRFTGKHPFNEKFSLLYQLEYANQDPYEDADNALDDNDYYLAELGGAFKLWKSPVVVKAGYEVLEGNGTNALQTPLATVHAFNGWNDKFVGGPGGTATPPGGLEDTYAAVVVKGILSSYIGPSKLVFQYHDFQANDSVGGVNDYGTEWGVLFAKPFGKEWLGLVKYDSFDDGNDGFSYDTDKWWVMAQYKFN